MLGKRPMAFEDILLKSNWSEEKTKIYLNSLLERNQIFISEEGKYYSP